MSFTRTQIGSATLAAMLLFGAASCTEPDPDPPIRVSGDPGKAIPETTSTTSTTIPATTTTAYFG